MMTKSPSLLSWLLLGSRLRTLRLCRPSRYKTHDVTDASPTQCLQPSESPPRPASGPGPRRPAGRARSRDGSLASARRPRQARDVLTVIHCGSRAGLAGWRRGVAGRQSAVAAPPSCTAVVHARGAGARSAMFHPQTPFGASQSLPAITKRSAGQNCVFNAACMWGHWGAGGGCPALPPRR